MRRAFTLIELMIVIAITFILAGLLLPAVHLVRNKKVEPKIGERWSWRGQQVEVVDRVSRTYGPSGYRVRIDHGPEARPRYEEITVEKADLVALTEQP